MIYSSILATFKIEYEACVYVKDGVDLKAPKINDRNSDQNIFRWTPLFKDCLASSHGSRRPLSYVLCEDTIITDDVMDTLLVNCFYRESRSFISELESRLPNEGPVFKI